MPVVLRSAVYKMRSYFLFQQRYLVYAILWSLSGDSRLKMRAELGEYIRRITTVPLPAAPNIPIIDYEVSVPGRHLPPLVPAWWCNS